MACHPLGRLRGISRKLTITLGILGGLALVCAAAAVLLAAKVIQDRAADSPSTVEPGDGFRHGGVAVDPGWEVVDDDGTFGVAGLVVKNPGIRDRSVFLEFSLLRDGEVVGYVTCSRELGPQESATADCFSADAYDAAFDEVRVADTF